jgi:WD40 repeat protein
VTFVCFYPDGSRIVSGSEDKTVRVWDAVTGQEVLKLEGNSAKVSSVCMPADGSRIVSGDADGMMRVWDAMTGQEMLKTRVLNLKAINSVCIAPNGELIVSAGRDGMQLTEATKDKGIFKGLYNAVYNSVCMSSDGKYMVGGGADNAVTVRDAISWSVHLTLKGHSDKVTSVCMDGGSRIMSGSEDKSIRVWDIVTQKEVLKLEGHSDAVTAVAVSPDGKYVVSGSRDMTMRLWDVAGGQGDSQSWRLYVCYQLGLDIPRLQAYREREQRRCACVGCGWGARAGSPGVA